ncbi:hypothetical protein IVB40_28115 [Bradyrhizobium sp. 40]|nr:hypothetical protein IVB40_28115 [Bradyrhizobium sp. 40]
MKSCSAKSVAKLKGQKERRAAQACAEASRVVEAIQVSMEIDQLIYKVGRRHDATAPTLL